MDERRNFTGLGIILFALLVLTRLPAMASYLSIDNVNLAFSLEKLAPGMKSWNEEQSRHNFAVVSQLVTPADPLKSRLVEPFLRCARARVWVPYHIGTIAGET